MRARRRIDQYGVDEIHKRLAERAHVGLGTRPRLAVGQCLAITHRVHDTDPVLGVDGAGHDDHPSGGVRTRHGWMVPTAARARP